MATTNLLPDSTGTNDWLTYPGGSVHTVIDEGTLIGGHTPNDADYAYSNTAGDDTTVGFGDTPSDANLITQIALNIRTRIDDGNATGRIKVQIFHSGSTQIGSDQYVTSTDLGGFGILAECVKTWSGLSLTKTQADSLTAKFTLLAS